MPRRNVILFHLTFVSSCVTFSFRLLLIILQNYLNAFSGSTGHEKKGGVKTKCIEFIYITEHLRWRWRFCGSGLKTARTASSNTCSLIEIKISTNYKID